MIEPAAYFYGNIFSWYFLLKFLRNLLISAISLKDPLKFCLIQLMFFLLLYRFVS